MTSSLLSSSEQQRLQLLPNVGRIPHLLVYFLKVVSYTHVPGNAARNRTVSEVFGIFQRDLDCGKHVCVLESATMLDKLPVDMQRDLLYITL